MRPAPFRLLLSSLCISSTLIAAAPARAADDGSWLEKAGEAAVVKGEYPRAVACFRGLAALRPKDPSPDYRLAEIYTLAGQYEEAIGEYRRFAARPEADPARKARAEAEAKRLEEAPAPFSETLFKQSSATPEAKRLFEEGKKDAQEKKWQPAINELQAALLLDPDLPGPYRLLGAVYGKTGDRAQERLFLADYLRVRPDGKIADTVRQTLAKEHVLGTLSVEASFPCKVYINGRDTGKTTPLKKYALPPGRYLVQLENEQYHMVPYLHVNISTGKDTEKNYEFGILQTKLDPWARVRVDGKDVGLWDEVGVPEGTHKITYTSHDGSKEKSVDLTIKGGARAKLSW